MTFQPFIMGLATAQVPSATGAAEWTAIVSAVALAIIALALLGAGIAAIILLRDVRRLTRTVDEAVTQLTPQTERLLHRAERVAEDAGNVTTSVRSSMDRVRDTVETADERARAALDDAEARIRRFGEVVGVLQSEIEEALLDAASTARGLQATASIFRRKGGRRRISGGRDSGERDKTRTGD